MRKTLTLLLTIGLVGGMAVAAGVGTAHAQVQLRTLPPTTKLAKVGSPQVLPYVQLNGAVVRLAPGGVIYDENNRSITQNMLPSGVIVGYITDNSGDIARIYILTPQERAQLKQ
jgi:hypothetical protein